MLHASNKQSRYDKRLILKIVREAESGLPRENDLTTAILGNDW